MKTYISVNQQPYNLIKAQISPSGYDWHHISATVECFGKTMTIGSTIDDISAFDDSDNLTDIEKQIKIYEAVKHRFRFEVSDFVSNVTKNQPKEVLNIEYLENLKYSWTAEVQLKNDVIIKIWYTALPSSKNSIKKVISVSSDYPRHTVKRY